MENAEKSAASRLSEQKIREDSLQAKVAEQVALQVPTYLLHFKVLLSSVEDSCRFVYIFSLTF